MTLPGPTLPPDLARLQDANVVTVIGEPRSGGARRGWAKSVMIALMVLLSGAAVMFYFAPIGRSSAETKLPAEVQAASAATQPASHPLAQYIEVTGFRIVVDYNKKSEIHYLIVNHSAADLSDVTVYVTLRAGNAKPGQPPLCRFSFRAPALGPFESKEMTSSIEKLSRSITLPEWQDLRSEVQIGQ
jgi:predicted membrane-bound mannosyltransferase